MLQSMLPLKGSAASLPGPIPSGDVSVELKTTGRTRYRLVLGQGPLAVLIHGISYPMDVYRTLAAELENAGRAVLLYDLTGRGFSHSSGEPMTIAHYIQQLDELLEALNLNSEPHDVVAWSLGSVIAAQFAHSRPSRVRRLVLLAPVGGIPPHKPLAAKLLHLPLGLGDLLATLFVPLTLKKLYRHELGQLEDGGQMLKFLCDHATDNHALPRALVSTLSSCPELDDNTAVLRAVGEHRRPCLVLWGSDDGTVDRQGIDAIMALLPHATLSVVEGERHTLFITAAAAVNKQIIAFLQVE